MNRFLTLGPLYCKKCIQQPVYSCFVTERINLGGNLVINGAVYQLTMAGAGFCGEEIAEDIRLSDTAKDFAYYKLYIVNVTK